MILIAGDEGKGIWSQINFLTKIFRDPPISHFASLNMGNFLLRKNRIKSKAVCFLSPPRRRLFRKLKSWLRTSGFQIPHRSYKIKSPKAVALELKILWAMRDLVRNIFPDGKISRPWLAVFALPSLRSGKLTQRSAFRILTKAKQLAFSGDTFSLRSYVSPAGLEPAITVPKTVVISISLQGHFTPTNNVGITKI